MPRMTIVSLALLLVACGGHEVKDFHLVLIGEMEEFTELDTWAPTESGDFAAEQAIAEAELAKVYEDLEELVAAKNVRALSRSAREEMEEYSAGPALAGVKLTASAVSPDGTQVLFPTAWDELPGPEGECRRLMVSRCSTRREEARSRHGNDSERQGVVDKKGA